MKTWDKLLKVGDFLLTSIFKFGVCFHLEL